ATEYPSIAVKTMQVKADPKVLLHMAEAVRSGKLSIPLGQRFALKDAKRRTQQRKRVPPGKSCWSRRRIQIRKKPQEHANSSSLALTDNKFLKSEVPEREISA
ncbi:MAG TPA: hypothetical protein VFO46_19755, partial [Candidatus Sulfotelmatobacter sp.]|nr:hypothetical protein [Candidatus Sulfotelmatobacter sp.]